jgi:cation-transporting ATPase 13A2
LLYFVGSNLSDEEFLYIDLIILGPLSVFMGRTGPYKTLTQHIPSSSLISVPVLSSVIGSGII